MSDRRRRERPRPAFSLVEILVTCTILGIVGLIFTRILLSQSRFADQQHALREARTASRQAMNILESELRMVQDSGGVDSAAVNGMAVRLLVPYRFGLICGVSGGKLVVSMLPVDSLSLAQARYAGYGWRTAAGTYQTVFPAAPLGADAPVVSADQARCTGTGASQAQIKTLTLKGRAGQILDITPPQPTASRGQAVYFFQRVTYSFKGSTAFPTSGLHGLYRTVQGGVEEEIMAPFDVTARFKYWKRKPGDTSYVSVSAPPASLDSIRGLDIVFVARSTYVPIGKSAASRASVTASIFFKNVRQ